MAERERGHGELILVADDAPDIVRLIEMVLKAEGYRVVTGKNGEEVLRLVATEKPDLLILDVMMPGIGGLEVCERLRSRAETADLPIIMLSALGQAPDRVRGLRAGADDYVAKPLDREELLARVVVHLNRARRLRAAQSQVVKRGRVFCFIGAKGGAGVTTVAHNVATLLAQQKKSVLLLELHPTFGTLSVLLKHTQPENLAALLDLEPARISGRELGARLYPSPHGVRVLFGPQGVDDFRALDAAHAEAIVQQAVTLADFVVIDLPHQPSEAHRAVAQLADLLLVVVEPEQSSIHSARIILRLAGSWGVIGNRVAAVVCNRSGATTTVSLPEIRTQLGCEIVGVAPFAGEACIAAMMQGAPLVVYRPENVAATTLRDMAGRLMAETITGIRV